MKNVYLLYAIHFLCGVIFWYAIEKLFMNSIGINFTGIGINAAVLYAMTLVFDIPSGILADRWSRKYTLLLGIAALGISTIILGLSQSLAVYLIGTIVYGAYLVLTSGTFEALMYDSLRDIHASHTYDHHQGVSRAIFMISIAGSSLVSGYLVNTIGFTNVFLISAIPAALALVLILILREPEKHKNLADTRLHTHLLDALRHVRHSRIIGQLGLFIIFESLLRNTMNEFGGVYYLGLGLGAVAMGYLNAGKWGADALGQLIAPRVGRVWALRLLPIGFVCYLLFSIIPNWVGVVCFLLAALSFSVSVNQTSAIIQDETPSHIRATLFSVFSFCSSFLFIPLSILFGYVSEHASVFVAFGIFGCIGLLYAIAWVLVKSRLAIPLRQPDSHPDSEKSA